ncbi:MULTISPECIES: DUF2977 domain-containing protein [Staphylococcus]|uniref:DUF2977 domain-containing protein n=1 Tax=Staphylococcus TaxID=1279 RepID=UPI003514FCF6
MEQQNENENKELKITINKNEEITGYAIVGGIEDEISIPYSKVPDGFRDIFKPNYYLYTDGEFKVNPNYRPSTDKE